MFKRGPACGIDNCPSVFYRVLNGRTVCQYGHVQVDSLEVDDEDMNYENGTAGRTRTLKVAGMSQTHTRHQLIEQRKRGRKPEKLRGEALNVAVIRSFQMLLSKMLKALAEQYGIEDRALFFKLGKHGWLRLLNKVYWNKDKGVPSIKIMYSDLILVCYWTLLRAGAPVYMVDLLHLAYLEKIPYMSAVRTIPESLSHKLPAVARRRFHGQIRNTGPFFDLLGVIDLVSDVELERFHFNYMPLLVRWVLEMYLPLEIVDIVERLSVPKDFVIMRRSVGVSHPELKLIGLLLVAAKVYFMDDQRMYTRWHKLFLENKDSRESLNADLDSGRIFAEAYQEFKESRFMRWDSWRIEQFAKAYYNSHWGVISNESILPHRNRVGQTAINERLNNIFPLHDMDLASSGDTTDKYRQHLAKVYAELYGSEAEDPQKSPPDDLIGLLIARLRIDTRLDLKEFDDVLLYSKDEVLKRVYNDSDV